MVPTTRFSVACKRNRECSRIAERWQISSTFAYSCLEGSAVTARAGDYTIQLTDAKATVESGMPRRTSLRTCWRAILST